MSEPAITADSYRIGFRDWLQLPEDNRLYEILEGDLFVSPPPSIEHQRILGRLHTLFYAHLQETGAGEVLVAPVGVRFSEDQVLEPDLLVVTNRNRHRIGGQVVEGAPDLVVEILSPGTASRDLGAKRKIYQQHGVGEYWIVDPSETRIEVLALRNDRYESLGLFSGEGRASSTILPTLEIQPRDVFLASP